MKTIQRNLISISRDKEKPRMESHQKDQKKSQGSFINDLNNKPANEERNIERIPFNFDGSLGKSLNISEVTKI